jgi:TP53 regulating kinase-like protein
MATPPPQQQPTNPRLPPPFSSSPDSLTLITQGAEALLYRTTFLTPTTPCALKIRLQKPWRHPALDKRLTRQRVLAEARVLLKCAKEGVRVPAVLGVSWEEGWVAAEWIEGPTVKAAVRGRRVEDEEGLRALMRRIGKAVGRLHAVGVVHGDLTTSNMMLKSEGKAEGEEEEKKEGGLEGEIVLIDFGLAAQTVQEEDRAVDLYVLERAFGSTHPREEGMFGEVLEGYREAFPKGSKGTLRRLEDVRMRGRKKSMIG